MPRVKPLGRRPPLDCKDLPFLLAMYREKAGMTALASAEKLGIADNTLRAKMKNPSRMTLGELSQYMDMWNVPPEEVAFSLGLVLQLERKGVL